MGAPAADPTMGGGGTGNPFAKKSGKPPSGKKKASKGKKAGKNPFGKKASKY